MLDRTITIHNFPHVNAVILSWILSIGSRGLVLGLWSACASVGNIMGALLTSAVLKYGYEVHSH